MICIASAGRRCLKSSGVHVFSFVLIPLETLHKATALKTTVGSPSAIRSPADVLEPLISCLRVPSDAAESSSDGAESPSDAVDSPSGAAESPSDAAESPSGAVSPHQTPPVMNQDPSRCGHHQTKDVSPQRHWPSDRQTPTTGRQQTMERQHSGLFFLRIRCIVMLTFRIAYFVLYKCCQTDNSSLKWSLEAATRNGKFGIHPLSLSLFSFYEVCNQTVK